MMHRASSGLISTIIFFVVVFLLIIASNCGESPCEPGTIRYKKYDYLGIYDGSVCAPVGTPPEKLP